MPKDISITKYLDSFQHLPLIDVRSPGEYAKGHIPNAHNIPLFSDNERAHVGTVYKQESKEAAINLGYKYVTPKLESFISDSLNVAPKQKAVIHCWRGGMRSHAFAQHLKDNGFKEIYVIEKGYKSFRNIAIDCYKEGTINILGGYTGSGKTHILHELKKAGHQIIDLEGLANHKGSAFGKIGMGIQPSTEQFENNLYWEWRQLDHNRLIWVEDESMNIGNVNIPYLMYQKIRKSSLYFIEISKEERAKLLVQDYVQDDKEMLADSIHRISKRLGSDIAKKALELLHENNFYEVALLALTYYDKYYKRGMSKRDPKSIHFIPLKDTCAQLNAQAIIKYTETVQYV